MSATTSCSRPHIELDGEGPARRASTQEALLARLRALPGVVHAGLINAFPLGRGQFANGTFIEMTRPDENHHARAVRINAPQFQGRVGEAEFRAASAGYFEAMVFRSAAAAGSRLRTVQARRTSP